ncbi:MAG: enoyl-CoA hydratase/isomerase family protein [Bacteroidales bacterium]|nr:enoyl-CoA hydratase/isomerase family protein [Bacteroidales bacterium]MDD4213909.1 enoyl-CoA hydratase/isomerase family protein [Bacteroidales bacterium]
MLNFVSCNINDNLCFIELNRPPSNSMGKTMFHELKIICEKIQKNTSLQAVIISGSGRHFSSGADVDDLLSHPGSDFSSAEDFFTINSFVFETIRKLKIPVIAIIKGVCIGVATELALSCHFRFAAPNIIIGSPESGFNLMPGCGGTYYLSELVDKKNSIEILLGGKNLNAGEALELGIVDIVINKSLIFEAAVSFAKNISVDYNFSLRQAYLYKYLKQFCHEKQKC